MIKVGHASATLPSVRLLRSGSWRVTGGLLALARADAGRKPGRRPSPDVIAYIDPSLPVESYLIDEAGHGNAVALLGRPDIGAAATLDIVLTHGI